MIPIIQHKDRAVSARDYRELGGDLLVSSWFATIQGEGPFAGYPAMFVRLAGCNYGSKDSFCQFCDTSFEFAKGRRFSPQALLDELVMDPGYNPKQILVITGGEPTLQISLLSLIVKAEQYFADIQVETNGTQPKFYREAVARGMTSMFKSVVSPKANMHLGRYPEIPDDVLWWASCLKFVVTSDETSPHHLVPQWALDTAKTIYVSPMAVYLRSYDGEVSSVWDDTLIDREATAKNYEYAAQYAIANQLRLSLQTHLFVALP